MKNRSPRKKAETRRATPNRNANVRQKSRFSSPRAKGRNAKTLPADRGPYEHETASQGSE